MSWESAKLNDVLEIKYGKDHKHLKNGNIPIYGSGGIMRFADNHLYDKESILIPRKGTLSNLFYVNIPFWCVDTIFYSIIKEGNIAKYLYYFLKSIDLTNLNVGSAVPSLSTEVLNKIEVSLPPLPTQKRIASILSAYDDLIENNLKRIKLLEETAQNIYKEWFVNFRFPNYENTPISQETGLPEGWKKGKVSDLCEVKSGYAFKSKDWESHGNPVVKIKNISNNTVDINDCDYVNAEVAKTAEKYELFEGDVLIAMTGATVGKVGLVPKIDKRIYLNQRVGLFRPFSEKQNNVYLIFSFFISENAQKQILNFAGGAAQPNISSTQISEVELYIGSDEILKMFENKINPIMHQIQILYNQNQKLKEARDILLPRLMNRTIEV